MSSIEYDSSEPNSKGIAIAIFSTVVFLLAIFFSTTVYYLSTITKEQYQKCNTEYSVERRNYENKQEEMLTTYKEMKGGKVKIPISMAMDYVVQEYQ